MLSTRAMVASRGLQAGALSVGLLLGVRQAQAQAQARVQGGHREFVVEYHAPATCPDRASLVAAIQARAQRPTALVDEAPLRFRVKVLESGRSQLWIEVPEGASQRELEAAPSCAEAIASLAVIAAMVLDADSQPNQAATEAAANLDETLALPPAQEPRPSLQPLPARSGPSPEGGAERSEPARVDARSSGPELRVSAAAGAAWESAVAPRAPLGGSAGFELAGRPRGWWAPRARAELLATASSLERTAAGEASFRLLAGRLSVCPVPLPLGRAVRLVPCASFDAGVLRGEGAGRAENVATKRMPWLSAGLTARLELDLVRWATLEATTGLRRLARHDRFVFRPQSLVYEVPGWSAGLGLGLGLHFD